MKNSAALRVTGDICFYFAILSAFPAFGPWMPAFAGFLALCYAAARLGAGLPSRAARLGLALLPGLSFFFMELRPLLVFPALAWLYLLLIAALGNFSLPLYEYRQRYRYMAIVCLFFVAGNAVNAMLFRGKALSLDCVIYLTGFLLIGVMTMREMQMGVTMDVRWRAANALTLLAILVAAAAVSLALYALLSRSKPVISFLFAPLGRLTLWLLGLLKLDGGAAGDASSALRPSPPPALPVTPDQGHGSFVMDEQNFTDGPVHIWADKAYSVGGYVVIGLLVLTGIWLAVRLARRGSPVPREEGPEYEAAEPGERFARRRTPRQEKLRGNAAKVRKLYREYLETLRRGGVRRGAADTSAEILAESRRISPETGTEAEEALRQIYLKARYSAESVTDQDVAEARQCLEAIRESKK